MKRTLKIGGILMVLAAPAAMAQVISFSDAANNQGSHYATANAYGLLYYGQGAYSDPGNNIWNGFGKNSGPGSTAFYGGGLTDNPNQAGNPGNPYAWSNVGPASGSHLFSPTGYGSVWSYNNPGPNGTAGNATSAGLLSSVTLTLSYSGENGLGNTGSTPANGTPSFLLGEAALVSGATLGTFSLGNVAQGTYNLYLYGANFDYDRGATFSITTGGGTALGGYTTAINRINGGSQGGGFILGDNYVEFTGVTAVGGVISGTWGAVLNSVTGQSGEGDFNGLQLVAVPEPTSLALAGLGMAGLLAARRRK